MNTNYGRLLAEKRHQFMELYLEEFYQEGWTPINEGQLKQSVHFF